MRSYTPSWSRTQRELFLNCPTAWARSYAKTNHRQKRGNVNHIRPWDLLLRSLKATVIEQLEALRSGTEWTTAVAELSLRGLFRDQLRTLDLSMAHPQFEAMLLVANHRMKLLWRTDVMVQLKRGVHPQWTVLDRMDSEHIEGFDLFASPDLAIRIQAKWHVIRLDMQSAKMNDSQRLEALAMIVWTTHRHGLPALAEQYVVKTIGWRKGAWLLHTFESTEHEVLIAKAMIRHDVKEMKRCAETSNHSIESLPLAQKQDICDTCQFKSTCLNGGTLESLKRKRILSLASSSN